MFSNNFLWMNGPSPKTRFVVGTNSTTAANKLLYSTQNDGSSWAAYTSNLDSTAAIYDIVYANNIWVGVGSFVKLVSPNWYCIVYSTDGINWTPTNPGSITNIYKVRYGGGKFLAVTAGATNTYFSSTDGINWTTETGLSSLIPQCYSVVYFNGYWYASGADGSGVGKIYRSTDAISWSLVFTYSPGMVALTTLATNGTILTVQAYFVNESWWSNNGTSWTKGTTPSGSNSLSLQYSNCIWAGGSINKFILAGWTGTNTVNKLWSSTDGKTWTVINTSAILGTTGNSGVIITNLNFDGTNVWLTRAGGNTPAGVYTGVLFKTTDLSTFSTVLTNTSFSLLGYTLYSVASKP